MSSHDTNAGARPSSTPERAMPSALQMFVDGVVATGAAIIIGSVIALRHTQHPLQWLLFAAIGLLTGYFTIKAGSVKATVSVTDTFFITAALLFGPGPAT